MLAGLFLANLDTPPTHTHHPLVAAYGTVVQNSNDKSFVLTDGFVVFRCFWTTWFVPVQFCSVLFGSVLPCSVRPTDLMVVFYFSSVIRRRS